MLRLMLRESAVNKALDLSHYFVADGEIALGEKFTLLLFFRTTLALLREPARGATGDAPAAIRCATPHYNVNDFSIKEVW